MDINKDISFIKRKLVQMDNCNDSNEFYALVSSLYYHINSIVFNFEHKKFDLGDIGYVSDNRTDSN